MITRILFTWGLAFTLAMGPARAADSAAPAEITVSAAISLKGALEEIGRAYEGAPGGGKVLFNFGSSGALAKQLENGAPAEVFVSAGAREMDALEKKGLLVPGSRADLLGNTLVLIAPKGDASVEKLADLRDEKVRRIAIGNPQTVPAGNYAVQALAVAGLTDAVVPKLLRAENVRQVLTYVETGNADAGLVYGTDAKGSAKVRVVAVIPAGAHEPIVYPAALMAASAHHVEGENFLKFLRGKAAAAVFKRVGFTLPQVKPAAPPAG